jgi:hypothetical protein
MDKCSTEGTIVEQQDGAMWRRTKMAIDKREAFVRLAERRTNSVLEKIRILGNLSNPYAYEYTEDDVRRIYAAIEQELKTSRAKFRNQTKKQFKLG